MLVKPIFFNRKTPPHFITLVIMSGVSAMTMSVFLPALNDISTGLNAPYAQVQLSVAIFLAGSAVMQLIIGPISDRIGRRPTLLIGISLYSLASMGAALSNDIVWFLTFRALQAVSATGMVLSRAIVRDQYERDESASILGYVTMGMSVVPMISPAIGGLINEAFGWEAIFVFQTGVAFLLLVLIYFDSGETYQRDLRPSSAAERNVWDLLTSYRFWGFTFAMGFSSGCFFGYLGGAAYVASVQYGLSSTQLGLFFAAPAVGYFLGNFFSGRYSSRHGVDRMVLWGSALTFVALSVLFLLVEIRATGPIVFCIMMIFMSIGNGLTLPNAMAGTLSVRPKLAGTAAGLGGAVNIGLGAVLSALAGTLIEGTQTEALLVWVMWLSSIGGMLAIGAVYWRMRYLKKTGAWDPSEET